MDHVHYQNGILRCESVDLPSLAEKFGTPLYVYSKRTLLDHYDRFAQAFSPLNAVICFSVKSCQNLSILRMLEDRGAAFDVVSGGELRRVMEIGADPSRVVFAGVGKTDVEIRAALEAGIGWFNLESEAELHNLASIAAATGKPARAALRVNPDVDPKTHVYTTTGKRETKFGVDLERGRCVFGEFRGRPALELCGIHLHIGSPVNTIDPYVESIGKGLTRMALPCVFRPVGADYSWTQEGISFDLRPALTACSGTAGLIWCFWPSLADNFLVPSLARFPTKPGRALS
jgi:diaminopimelate decarboxylase